MTHKGDIIGLTAGMTRIVDTKQNRRQVSVSLTDGGNVPGLEALNLFLMVRLVLSFLLRLSVPYHLTGFCTPREEPVFNFTDTI